MDVRNQAVTTDNFWEARSTFEKELLKANWAKLKWHSLISFTFSIIKRTFVSFIVVPPTIAYTIFVLENLDHGLIYTYNAWFIGMEPLTQSSAAAAVTMWLFIGFVIFGFSWILPWVSPAKRETENTMREWWTLYGSKVPMVSRAEAHDKD